MMIVQTVLVSLGNDETVLPAGFVCDPCNQYLGSKIEAIVVNAPPFGVERVRSGVITKKGKPSIFKVPPHLELYSTPIEDEVFLAASPDYLEFISGIGYLLLPQSPHEDFLTARLLLKIGLELLLLTGKFDPYGSEFDLARRYVRAPKTNDQWQFAYGLYPHKEELILEEKEDEFGLVRTQQLYQYEIGSGQMVSDAIVLMQ